jgi:hypothetical protein
MNTTVLDMHFTLKIMRVKRRMREGALNTGLWE